jgi:hypothetical protein
LTPKISGRVNKKKQIQKKSPLSKLNKKKILHEVIRNQFRKSCGSTSRKARKPSESTVLISPTWDGPRSLRKNSANK